MRSPFVHTIDTATIGYRPDSRSHNWFLGTNECLWDAVVAIRNSKPAAQPKPKTVRVPAIGQRVQIHGVETTVLGHSNRPSGLWVRAKLTDNFEDGYEPRVVKPVGPNPRFVDITIQEA